MLTERAKIIRLRAIVRLTLKAIQSKYYPDVWVKGIRTKELKRLSVVLIEALEETK